MYPRAQYDAWVRMLRSSVTPKGDRQGSHSRRPSAGLPVAILGHPGRRRPRVRHFLVLTRVGGVAILDRPKEQPSADGELVVAILGCPGGRPPGAVVLLGKTQAGVAILGRPGGRPLRNRVDEAVDQGDAFLGVAILGRPGGRPSEGGAPARDGHGEVAILSRPEDDYRDGFGFPSTRIFTAAS